MKYAMLFALVMITFLNTYGQTTKGSHKSVADKIKQLLEEHYVIEKKVKAISLAIDAINYDDLNDEKFVDKINAILFESSKDKHLHLEYNPTYAQKMLSNSDANDDQRKEEHATNFGFNKLEILPGNIGFLKLTYFADPSGLDELVKGSLTFVKNTDHLIVDLRANSGGSGTMLQKLVSGFVKNDGTPFLKIQYKTNTVQLKTDSLPLFQYEKPVYLLCDAKTFSAGEGFALILQNRKIATVIGEVTAGAGNIAGPYPVLKDFVLTIPVGIIVDPLTGTGWEGSGVVPDVAVAPDSALQKALEIIKHRKR